MTRNSAAAAKLSLEEVVRDTAEKLAVISGRLEKLDSVETTLFKMEQTMGEIKAENQVLKTAMAAKDEEIRTLSHRLNDLEQYVRGGSIRVLNIPLTSEEERSNFAVADKLYNIALKPILMGAMEEGIINYIPSREQLLETAHVLPGKPGEHKPIIARFYSRDLRRVIFQHKKKHAPRKEVQGRRDGGDGGRAGGGGGGGGGGDGGAERMGGFCFPIYEDLTRANFSMMRSIAGHKDVQSCWSVNGQLKFKLIGSDIVKKVSSINDTVDNIIIK